TAPSSSTPIPLRGRTILRASRRHGYLLAPPGGTGASLPSNTASRSVLAMAHIVTERCVNCRYTYCAVECPVACFWEITSPHMLLIDPDTCIDCEACVPACPVNAIWPDHELPEVYVKWTAFNAQHFKEGTNVTAGSDPLPSA